MHTFKQIPKHCRPCLERLARQAANLACPEDKKALDLVLSWLYELYDPTLPPPLIASRLHLRVKKHFKVYDPYKPLKEKEMAVAQRLAQELLPHYQENGLEGLLALALLGNAIDFFRPLDEIERAFRQGVSLTIDHRKSVVKALDKAKSIVYLTDNAGELFFDLPLLRALADKGIELYYAVKPEPLQNDLCLDDLKGLDISLPVPVVSTGARIVGLLLEEASPEFVKLYEKADLIFAKGMGHFETMSAAPRLEHVVFMLCAKCIPVSTALEVPLNSYVCFWKGAE